MAKAGDSEAQAPDASGRASAPGTPAHLPFPSNAYPDELAKREDYLVNARRTSTQSPSAAEAPAVGFGLSGGGIRSATFSLGLFQALAGQRLVQRIDFLSTVSGGGYFGAFFATLFGRPSITAGEAGTGTESSGAARAEDVLRGCRNPEVLRRLRENGRYLAPNGAGDLLLGGAVLLRNWVALQIVLLTTLLAVFLGLQAVAVVLDMATWPFADCLDNGRFWLSPWLLASAILFALWAFPAGWSYWFVGRHGFPHPALTLLGALVAGCWSLRRGLPRPHDWDTPAGAWLLVVLACVLTVFQWGAVRLWVRSRRRPRSSGSDSASNHVSGRALAQEQHNLLSKSLKTGLVASGVLLLVATVDSLALTAWREVDGDDLIVKGASLGGTVLALSGLARRVAVFFSNGGSSSRPRLPVALLATVVAALLALAILVAVDVLALGFRFQFGQQAPAPTRSAAAPIGETLTPQAATGDSLLLRPTPATGPAQWEAPKEEGREGDESVEPMLWWALGITSLLTLLFGHARAFLNRSSHHALYSARLSRAYLGASNPNRQNTSLSAVLPTDEPELAEYWGNGPTSHGAPIHLINLTVNETVHGETGIQQQDRKGVGLAVGPAGLSLGVQHHLGVNWADKSAETRPVDHGDFKVFREPIGGVERLTLGEWVGLSGAAFSTGTGYHTSLGMSFLAGFGNVRLGRWWHSGSPACGGRIGLLERGAFKAFPVQAYLASEFAARFPGTSRSLWYLSDGGHFENMGGYELIRRRLRRMVIVDAECDPDYQLQGLGNLVRKARIDFATEIRFWGDAELRRHFCLGADRESQEARPYQDDENQHGAARERPWLALGLGTLRDLERPSPNEPSLAHAAVADVCYPEGPDGTLLYIKPTLRGDEPVDVLHYHAENPAFPQQTTADQFFDEAQWESYRRLGEHIGLRLFDAPIVRDLVFGERGNRAPK